MGHYAIINSDNKVIKVYNGKEDTADLPEGFDSWEAVFQAKHEGTTCLQTSYNTLHNQHLLGGTPLRGNFAGKGYTYDSENDIFMPPKKYPSWTLDVANAKWVAPVAKTEGQEDWDWDEANQEWSATPHPPTNVT